MPDPDQEQAAQQLAGPDAGTPSRATAKQIGYAVLVGAVAAGVVATTIPNVWQLSGGALLAVRLGSVVVGVAVGAFTLAQLLVMSASASA